MFSTRVVHELYISYAHWVPEPLWMLCVLMWLICLLIQIAYVNEISFAYPEQIGTCRCRSMDYRSSIETIFFHILQYTCSWQEDSYKRMEQINED